MRIIVVMYCDHSFTTAIEREPLLLCKYLCLILFLLPLAASLSVALFHEKLVGCTHMACNIWLGCKRLKSWKILLTRPQLEYMLLDVAHCYPIITVSVLYMHTEQKYSSSRSSSSMGDNPHSPSQRYFMSVVAHYRIYKLSCPSDTFCSMYVLCDSYARCHLSFVRILSYLPQLLLNRLTRRQSSGHCCTRLLFKLAIL